MRGRIEYSMANPKRVLMRLYVSLFAARSRGFGGAVAEFRCGCAAGRV